MYGECFVIQFVMLVEDARGILLTALYVVMSVSFCLPHPVAVSGFIIYSCVCVRVLRCVCCMRVLDL